MIWRQERAQKNKKKRSMCEYYVSMTTKMTKKTELADGSYSKHFCPKNVLYLFDSYLAAVGADVAEQTDFAKRSFSNCSYLCISGTDFEFGRPLCCCHSVFLFSHSVDFRNAGGGGPGVPPAVYNELGYI